MTRQECETKILKKVVEIEGIMKEYNPNGEYLTIAIIGGGDIDIHNEYWKDDLDKPIKFWLSKEERNEIKE